MKEKERFAYVITQVGGIGNVVRNGCVAALGESVHVLDLEDWLISCSGHVCAQRLTPSQVAAAMHAVLLQMLAVAVELRV